MVLRPDGAGLEIFRAGSLPFKVLKYSDLKRPASFAGLAQEIVMPDAAFPVPVFRCGIHPAPGIVNDDL